MTAGAFLGSPALEGVSGRSNLWNLGETGIRGRGGFLKQGAQGRIKHGDKTVVGAMPGPLLGVLVPWGKPLLKFEARANTMRGLFQPVKCFFSVANHLFSVKWV